MFIVSRSEDQQVLSEPVTLRTAVWSVIENGMRRTITVPFSKEDRPAVLAYDDLIDEDGGCMV